MKIDFGNKYIRMAISGIFIATALVVFIYLISSAIGMKDLSLPAVIFFSSLVSGLAVNWIFRNVFE